MQTAGHFPHLLSMGPWPATSCSLDRRTALGGGIIPRASLFSLSVPLASLGGDRRHQSMNDNLPTPVNTSRQLLVRCIIADTCTGIHSSCPITRLALGSCWKTARKRKNRMDSCLELETLRLSSRATSDPRIHSLAASMTWSGMNDAFVKAYHICHLQQISTLTLPRV
ncbi:hypothetical protein BD289DRAFT_434728 [Coniella lustricola]|uniref:Uncharacterized protein n=1 Tax=Coniella lustricola TaxID=2025994 RepID=A0A2T3A6Z3_9PEZI|nr:hypothetical protein BD289DRAFT_434728 [Coniella lustricola]